MDWHKKYTEVVALVRELIAEMKALRKELAESRKERV